MGFYYIISSYLAYFYHVRHNVVVVLEYHICDRLYEYLSQGCALWWERFPVEI